MSSDLDQSALLVMVREQAILNSSGGGANGNGSGDNVGAQTPVDVFPSPATAQAPTSVTGSSLVPIPSGVYPATPVPPPVPVHDAGSTINQGGNK